MRRVLVRKNGGAYNFGLAVNGEANKYFTTPSLTNFGYNTYTVSFWGVARNNNRFFLGNSAVSTIYVRNLTSPDRIDVMGANTFDVGAIVFGDWFHLMFTQDGSNLRVYYNGVESVTGSLPNSISLQLNQVGRYASTTLGLAGGNIDDLVIWDGVVGDLSDAQRIYNDGNGVNPSIVISNPTHWYKFNGDATDSGSSGLDLIPVNSPTYTPHI